MQCDGTVPPPTVLILHLKMRCSFTLQGFKNDLLSFTVNVKVLHKHVSLGLNVFCITLNSALLYINSFKRHGGFVTFGPVLSTTKLAVSSGLPPSLSQQQQRQQQQQPQPVFPMWTYSLLHPFFVPTSCTVYTKL